MKKGGRKNVGLRCGLFVMLIIIVLAIGVYSHFGGFGTGKCADTEEFAKYATPVADITIPEQTQIVALGEATHGNAEFQQLKLDVFQIMVEKYGVKAFALEGDFGGCEAVNRYIHGGDGKRIDHTFYSYDSMAKASKKCGFEMSYLDFSKISETSKLKSQVTGYTWMGSLGESYSTLYMILPRSYRVWISQADAYDAMIYVTNAHPIDVMENK